MILQDLEWASVFKTGKRQKVKRKGERLEDTF
jgi:hypothetical protein